MKRTFDIQFYYHLSAHNVFLLFGSFCIHTLYLPFLFLLSISVLSFPHRTAGFSLLHQSPKEHASCLTLPVRCLWHSTEHSPGRVTVDLPHRASVRRCPSSSSSTFSYLESKSFPNDKSTYGVNFSLSIFWLYFKNSLIQELFVRVLLNFQVNGIWVVLLLFLFLVVEFWFCWIQVWQCNLKISTGRTYFL